MTVDGGCPAQLAVIAGDGTIVAVGNDGTHEFEDVAVNSYRSLLQGQGHVRVSGAALTCAASAPAHAHAVISAVVHEGPTVIVNGQPAQFAIVAEAGAVIATGKVVAREAEAVAINAYRDFLKENGILREVLRGPPVSTEDYAVPRLLPVAD